VSAAAPWPRAAWLLIATLLLLGSVLAAVTIGPADISTLDVWRSIAMHLGLPLETGLTPLRDSIVWDSRLPRVLAAGVVGAGLALSGAVVQAVTRNPLADPYLLGLSAGAALGAVTMIMIGAPLLLTPGAFVGALAALALTLAFARAIGGLTPSKAILSGIAVSALAAALTSLVIFWTATGDSYREILSWLLGSLAGAGWLEAAIAAAALVVVAPLVLLSARAMDAFAFGDVAAATLGIDVARTRWLLLGGTALLTGVLVSVSGAIGFVGLVLPHAARLVAGSRHRGLLPLAAIGGAVFMIWTDTAARTLFAPRELPVGIVTAIVGAPAFLLILWRFRRLT
jgi:iron complex transport system permease protein